MENSQKTTTPEIGKFDGFFACKFFVNNAKITAEYYTSKFGFHNLAYKGLETGCRDFCSYVVSNGKVIFELCSAYNNKTDDQKDLYSFIANHGDGVKEIMINIDNVEKAYEVATKRGAKPYEKPNKIENDKGYVTRCAFEVQKDTSLVLIDRSQYKGKYLPGFKEDVKDDPINLLLDLPKYNFIDHIVSNHGVGDMQPTVDWYLKMLDFHVFWSADDKIIHTEYSSLKSIVVADHDETIKMPQNEPAVGKRGKSQIQEYVDYYNGSGVQHIAINVDDILTTISLLKKRGVQFLEVPSVYYDNLKKRLETSNIKVKEDLDKIAELGILVDFDEKGYLLQLFTKNNQDRPTFFFEFIQRENNDGFGAGNFKSLFEAIELAQKERGNLFES